MSRSGLFAGKQRSVEQFHNSILCLQKSQSLIEVEKRKEKQKRNKNKYRGALPALPRVF
jgi:hypothetical protein